MLLAESLELLAQRRGRAEQQRRERAEDVELAQRQRQLAHAHRRLGFRRPRRFLSAARRRDCWRAREELADEPSVVRVERERRRVLIEERVTPSKRLH